MKYDRAEAVRYMGAKKDDNEAAVLADLAYLQLRNEVRPRSCWQIFAGSPCSAGPLPLPLHLVSPPASW